MIVSLIAAMANNRIIGDKGKMPWHIPEELAYFKSVTLNHTVIMGRKTCKALGEPLEYRRNLVITSHKIDKPGFEIFHSIRSALTACKDSEEVFIIGGAQLYASSLDIADRLYLSFLDKEYNGDTYFPEFNKDLYTVVSEERVEASIPFTRRIYERKTANR